MMCAWPIYLVARRFLLVSYLFARTVWGTGTRYARNIFGHGDGTHVTLVARARRRERPIASWGSANHGTVTTTDSVEYPFV